METHLRVKLPLAGFAIQRHPSRCQESPAPAFSETPDSKAKIPVSGIAGNYGLPAHNSTMSTLSTCSLLRAASFRMRRPTLIF